MNYEYQCPHCGIFEVQQKITEEPLANCPQCSNQNRQSPVKRLISASNFILAGSGWSRDNYSGK